VKQFDTDLVFFEEQNCPDLGSYVCVDVYGEGGFGNTAIGMGRTRLAAIKAARKRLGRLLKDLDRMEKLENRR